MSTRRTFIGAGLAATLATLATGDRLAGQVSAAAVQVPSDGPPMPPGREIPLWPEGVPGVAATGGEERVEDGRIYNVRNPTLTWFPAPAAISVQTAVIICPGGGYVRLAVNREGNQVTRFLNALGVTAFILKYRLAEFGHPAPLCDVLRAVRLVRSRAGEFGVDAARIGVQGSSAGGHLAACAGTLFDAPEGRTGHALDAVSARPDFMGLLYPVISLVQPFSHAGSGRSLLGPAPSPALLQRLSLETQVSARTPPAFIVHTAEDKSVPVENSIVFYQALRRCGVPVEMHLYEKGPHGFGTAKGLGTTSDWPRRWEEWMRASGWLQRG